MDLNQVESRPELELTLTASELTVTAKEREKREGRELYSMGTTKQSGEHWCTHRPAGP